MLKSQKNMEEKKKKVKLEPGMRWKGNSIEYRPCMEIDGEIVRKSFSGQTPAEVKRKRDKFLAGEKIKKEAAHKKNKITPTVFELGKKWIDIYKTGPIKSGSTDNYNIYLNRQIKGSNIDMPIHQLDSDALQLFFNQRSYMSKSAINYLRIIVDNVIRISRDKGYISPNYNPMDGVTLPKPPEAKIYAFDECASSRVFNFTFEHYFGLPIRVMLTIGCRPGELIALQWQNINIEERSIHICCTLSKADGGFEISDTTKTGISRYAYIHDAILDDLIVGKYIYDSRVKVARRKKEPQPPPFVFSYNGGYMSRYALEYHYKKFFSDLNASLPAGEEIEYKSPNKCRTTFATTLLKKSENIRAAQIALGHTNVKTTQKYTNPTFDDLKSNVQKLRY